ncbi:DUF4435 domain-containing protein [Azospirillum sp. B21]|uniref:DUF4435 domain-containing protein n=1 Tax=Azospirillum sp. B21 TaxID=2607496 RepID=UPI0011EE0BB9|nr:DUF4435 domain-containing protein [Azospirillum sp. B21]KAA0573509.1 DUF4435 domain-containing protein [Azospirillum sp. B21]
MLKYSPRAVPGLVRILKRYNEITIFVEDATYKNMYQIYFERMLKGRINVRSIFPLNGREKVIEAAKSGRYKRYDPCFFLIDGDLDILRGIDCPPHEGLIRLSVYCSENLLFCEQAAIELAFESSPDMSKSEISKKINFKTWRKEIIRKLKPLFISYAAAQHFKVTVQTVSLNAHVFLEGSGSERVLSERKISEKIRQVEAEILKKTTLPELNRFKKSIDGKISTNNLGSTNYFSGKTYLMPLLYNHLRGKTDFSDKEAAMKLRLARYASFEIDGNLTRRVEEVVSNIEKKRSAARCE